MLQNILVSDDQTKLRLFGGIVKFEINVHRLVSEGLSDGVDCIVWGETSVD